MDKDIGFLKTLLNNSTLLKWVKKYSADGLQEESISKHFYIDEGNNSVCVTDTEKVKMFFSDSRFSGKTFVSFDIKQLKEVLALVGDSGKLIIGEDKPLGYIESDNNVIVIAPMSHEQKPETKSEPEPKQVKKK